MKNEQTLPSEKITANSEQLAVLKNNFPQCFDKQGKFIVSKLQEILQADGVDLSRESYSLNWLGKSYARVLANEPIRTMLSEDTEHNEQEQNKNSHNLLIQGDNLEVLKHLKGAYTDKVKMIYIDPPYNTGSDGFVYQDDRSFSPEQFAELAGVDLDEAKRVLDFTQSNANSHSAWLTFIYPRLYIAKQLLKDDGVIFISIDDSEQAQLKILCDEIFGEANFIEQIIWKKRGGAPNDRVIGATHEYILIYSKDISQISMSLRTRTEEQLGRYKNPDNHPKGRWIADNLMANVKGGRFVKSLYYPILNPQTNEEFYPSSNGNWRFNQQKMQELLDNDAIYFGEDGKGRPKLKRFLCDVKDGVSYPTIWDFVPFNNSGSAEIANILGNLNIFDTPKPTGLMMELIHLANTNNEICLDFFVGSGTIAHAVMKQNAEDGGNRQFIGVQIPEQISEDKEAYQAGYRTIFDITKDRIIKAGEKLDQEYPESNFERGFKIFKTCDNFLPENKIQQLTLNFDELKITPDAHHVDLNFTEKLVSNDFSDTQLQDILSTWKGLDKIFLSENLKVVNLGNYLAYGFGHVLYLVNKGFTIESLKDLIQKLDDEHEFQVSKLVLLGHHFDSATQREIDEAMKTYSNKKSIPVDVVVRY